MEEVPGTTFATHQDAIEQKNVLKDMWKLCLEKINNTTRQEGYCEVSWDGVYCWPSTPAGKESRISCPSYIHGFSSQAFATRYCTTAGTWFKKEGDNVTWTNYTNCVNNYEDSVLSKSLFEPHMDNIKMISTVGYAISLATLLVAFLILAFVRRLRCPRNNLHMQLFVSFIMRSAMCLLKDFVVTEDVSWSNNSTISDVMNNLYSNVDCKIFISFWHYFLMANYCWILMEGVYLHNLIFLALFTDTSSILKYLLAGWGLPILFIVPWSIMRATMDDTLCWTTNKSSEYFWIIRGPITASILINFVLFINITRVLFMKMFDSKNSYAKQYRYRKWFRSTLVLVPLFGVHYAIFLAMSLAAGDNTREEVVWLYIDQLFSSSQGSFVAFLYCFLNGEVQAELKKIWQAKMMSKESPFSRSLLNQSLTSYVSRGRNSVQSFHSTTANEKKHPVQGFSPSIVEERNSKKASYGERNPSVADDLDERLVTDTLPKSPCSDTKKVENHASISANCEEVCLLISGKESEHRETNL